MLQAGLSLSIWQHADNKGESGHDVSAQRDTRPAATGVRGAAAGVPATEIILLVNII
jgi:hypothetical protein